MTDTQRGMSLILVMSVVAALSLILFAEVSRRSADNRDRQFNFTLAQTEYVLNSAYAYFTERGRWPVSNRRCLLPPEFTGSDGSNQGLLNGWGEAIEGGRDCREDSSRHYRFYQRIPAAYVEAFRGRLSERTEIVERDEDFSTVEIWLNRSGGALRDISFGDFSVSENDPLRYEPPVCTNRAGVEVDPLVVVGINGACALRGNDLDGIDSFGGFRTRLGPDHSVFYDFYEVFYEESTNEDGETTGSYGLLVDAEDSLSNRNIGGDGFLDDGLLNADEECPPLSPIPWEYNPVRAMVLAWCPSNN